MTVWLTPAERRAIRERRQARERAERERLQAERRADADRRWLAFKSEATALGGPDDDLIAVARELGIDLDF